MRAGLTLAMMLSCASGGAAQPASELAGRVPGPPESCIELDRVTGPIIENATSVMYRQSGARIWRMTPREASPALREGAHLLIVGSISRRLCEGDRFDVLPPGSPIPSGHCRIGNFTPYDKEPT